MKIQELDPSKKYVVGLSSEFVTVEDIKTVKQRLDDLGISSVVINDPGTVEMARYFGIYCEQCGVWARKQNGELYSYPTPEIATAHINTDAGEYPDHPARHLYQAQEFGAEIHKTKLKPEDAVCPVKVSLLSQSFSADLRDVMRPKLSEEMNPNAGLRS